MKAEEPSASRPRVLVIDDEPGFRDMLAFELGAHGYDVTTAVDGEDALAKARGARFDVALSDMAMPRRGGLETLGALRGLDPGLEVVMVTGYATLEGAVESMKRGAYDFLVKPYELRDLLRLLERALEKRRLARRVDELQELNRFKSEFIANMSHELRTPMNAVLGYTSLMLDGVYGELPPRQEEALHRVEASGRALLQLINSVLDLSKLAAGRMPVALEDFALGDLAADVLGMLDGLARTKGLALETRVPAGLRLRSDRTKVKQVLLNLVANGIKFTQAGGVTVSAEAASDGTVRVSVMDTGIGIAAEDVPKLFQEFRQLDSSPTRAFGGTGLGLAICRRFAELLGGGIEVESLPGRGSTFTVRLPQGTPEPAPSFAPPAAQPGRRLLLAIDDDPDVLALLRDALEGSGYAFAGALTGEEGLALARRLRPFAITLDIMMPRKDGWSVLQALKDEPALRDIPVVILSILDNKGLGYALGVSDYIVKPFERRSLLETLKALERVEGGHAR